MYQEETYETNDDDAREAAQLADGQARFDYEADLQQQTLWEGPLVSCVDDPIAIPASRVTRMKEVA
jgi:hypothetical protein